MLHKSVRSARGLRSGQGQRLCMLRAVLALGLLLPATALRADDTAREQLHAVLWMQTAAEYRVLARQSWNLATERLRTISQPGTAAVEQADMPAAALASLPTAIIVDIDETVLDNSYFQARMLRDHQEYSDAAWDVWVAQADAPTVPGAREFLLEAARLGHRVFYVSNRECPRVAVPSGSDPCPAKTYTQRNLAALGLPGADDPANFLFRRERPEWSSSDKTGRRVWLAQRYRIVAMAGDDIRDFIDRPFFDARREELMPLFGTRWFMLPNAMYGSWERALVEDACPAGTAAADCAQLNLQRKYALLETAPAVTDLASLRLWDGGRERLRLATWNIEYLIEPSTYAALDERCIKDNSRVPGSARQIPCDIVPRLNRRAADFAALRRYASQLDADVIALEEVDGPAAAAQVFPGYDFCFSGRPNVQKNGFAIRRGLPFRCEPEYLPISMDDAERRGVVVTLFPGSASQITLLGVHLRSGCPEGPLNDARNERCPRFSAQVPYLKAWIDQQASAGQRFAVLGDFNRRLGKERGVARDGSGRLMNLWPELNAGVTAGKLVNVTATPPFRNCVPGDGFDSYIDSVIVGPALAGSLIKGSFQRITYSAEDAQRFRLSDHCPVGIDLRLH